MSTAKHTPVVLHQNKSWAECSIDHWLAMQSPSDESNALLQEILREHRKDLLLRKAVGARRLRSGMVTLRRVMRHENRASRVRAANMRQYYREDVTWPFGPSGSATVKATRSVP